MVDWVGAWVVGWSVDSLIDRLDIAIKRVNHVQIFTRCRCARYLKYSGFFCSGRWRPTSYPLWFAHFYVEVCNKQSILGLQVSTLLGVVIRPDGVVAVPPMRVFPLEGSTYTLAQPRSLQQRLRDHEERAPVQRCQSWHWKRGYCG